MRNFIPEHSWESIHRAWALGAQTVMQIASDHGIHHDAIRKRAKRDKWQARGKNRGDPTLASRILYDDLTDALRAGLDRLRERPETETHEQARERGLTIRAHHKALGALVDGLRKLPEGRTQSETVKQVLFTKADEEAVIAQALRTIACSEETAEQKRLAYLADPVNRCPCGQGLQIADEDLEKSPAISTCVDQRN